MYKYTIPQKLKISMMSFFLLFITVFIKALQETFKIFCNGGKVESARHNGKIIFFSAHKLVLSADISEFFFFLTLHSKVLLGRHVAVLACSRFSDQQKGWLQCLTGLRGFDGCFGAINCVDLNKTQSLFCFAGRNWWGFFYYAHICQTVTVRVW